MSSASSKTKLDVTYMALLCSEKPDLGICFLIASVSNSLFLVIIFQRIMLSFIKPS